MLLSCEVCELTQARPRLELDVAVTREARERRERRRRLRRLASILKLRGFLA